MVIDQIANDELRKGGNRKDQKCILSDLCRATRQILQSFVEHLGQGEGRTLKDQPAHGR